MLTQKKFDWRRFCTDYGISFLVQGSNVAHGNINCQCPFCDDPSEHLGLSLDPNTPSWGCWRCKAGGRSPVRLVCKLAGVTLPQALQIVAAHNETSPDAFECLLDPPQEAPNPPRGAAQKLPAGCRMLDGSVGARRFVQYLAEERGFGGDVLRLAKLYSIHFALVGDQASRIVFPVYEKGLLQAWTGRAIHAQSPLRYKADYGGKIKQCLANSDVLLAGHKEETLVIAEGPMDFLKLDFFGAIHGLRATCTFGTAWSLSQVSKLIPIVQRFKRTVVLYDQEAYMAGAQLAEEVKAFSHCNVAAMEMFGAKDPGALTPQGVAHLAKELTI